jgi:hypothetical protein
MNSKSVYYYGSRKFIGFIGKINGKFGLSSGVAVANYDFTGMVA